MKAADNYEMALAKIVEQLSNLRDQLTDIGMKSLPDDLKFLYSSVPTYTITAETLSAFNLLMQLFRITADAFTHYQLNGFVTDDEKVT